MTDAMPPEWVEYHEEQDRLKALRKTSYIFIRRASYSSGDVSRYELMAIDDDDALQQVFRMCIMENFIALFRADAEINPFENTKFKGNNEEALT